MTSDEDVAEKRRRDMEREAYRFELLNTMKAEKESPGGEDDEDKAALRRALRT